MSEVTKRKRAKLASVRKRAKLASVAPSEESVWTGVFILLLEQGYFTIPATMASATPTVQRPLFCHTIVMAKLDWRVLRMLFSVCNAYRRIYLEEDVYSLAYFSLKLEQNVECVNSHLVCICRQNARLLMLAMTQQRILERVLVNGAVNNGPGNLFDWTLEYSPSRIIAWISIRRPSYEDLLYNSSVGLVLLLQVANHSANTVVFGLPFAPWTLSEFEHHVAGWLISFCMNWQHVDV
jgi:hypothetical protein